MKPKENRDANPGSQFVTTTLNTQQVIADNLLTLSTTLAVLWFLFNGGRI
jgi:hypothetical protein